MYGKSKAKTVGEYLEELGEPRKSDFVALDKLIKKASPDLKPFMMGGMAGYGKYQYKYASGREGEWPLIAMANQKNYISLYISCVTDEGKYVAEQYKDELPKANIGKSCVRFKKLADLDQKVLTKMIKEAAKIAKKKKYAFDSTEKKA